MSWHIYSKVILLVPEMSALEFLEVSKPRQILENYDTDLRGG